ITRPRKKICLFYIFYNLTKLREKDVKFLYFKYFSYPIISSSQEVEKSGIYSIKDTFVMSNY
ncbi:MAG: hypothetical protein M3Z01_04940, partial [Thermoproteota archaeon]|nr:hypothetical protein [Thermoproteota archaeon]